MLVVVLLVSSTRSEVFFSHSTIVTVLTLFCDFHNGSCCFNDFNTLFLIFIQVKAPSHPTCSKVKVKVPLHPLCSKVKVIEMNQYYV